MTRQQELLDKLMTGLDLKFKDATGEEEDGWYVWRGYAGTNIVNYEIVHCLGRMICVECSPYGPTGQLAGPILGGYEKI